MILRARIKAFADMPPGVPCCEHMRQQLAAFGEREIQVNPSSRLKRCYCQGCKTKFMGMRVARMRGWRIDPRAWEIEESPVSPQSHRDAEKGLEQEGEHASNGKFS